MKEERKRMEGMETQNGFLLQQKKKNERKAHSSTGMGHQPIFLKTNNTAQYGFFYGWVIINCDGFELAFLFKEVFNT
jgi:hypothetical protein